MPIHSEFTRFREISPRREIALPSLFSAPFIVVGAITLFGLASTVLLWAYAGTAIFFETIRNGFAVCFG
jgi:hypothetical protein